jgi:hypothetical protein
MEKFLAAFSLYPFLNHYPFRKIYLSFGDHLAKGKKNAFKFFS